MKWGIFIFLTLCFCNGLHARQLDQEKILEALNIAYKHTNPNFFAEMDASLFDSEIVPYHLILQNIPSKTQFELYVCNLSNVLNPTFVARGYVNQNSETILCLNGEQKLENVHFGGKFEKGEPVYHFLVTEGQKDYLATIFVPHPIEAFDENGRHVCLELLSELGDKFLLRGENYLPNEEITITYMRDAISDTVHLKASDQGTFGSILKSKSNNYRKGKVNISTPHQKTICMKYYWGFPDQFKIGSISEKTNHLSN